MKKFRPRLSYIIPFVTLGVIIMALYSWERFGSATPSPPDWQFKTIILLVTWFGAVAFTYIYGTIRVGRKYVFGGFPIRWKSIDSIVIGKKKVLFIKNRIRIGGFKRWFYPNSRYT